MKTLKEVFEKRAIHQVMGRKMLTISPDSSARVAAEKLVGIITEADFVKAFLN